MGVKLSQTKAERNAEINKAIKHSETTHAPADAEKNVIVGIQKNGVDVAVDSNRKSNITVPTKLSELTNDKNFITASGNAGTATKWATARNINGMTVDGTANITNYGTCSTAADTAAKTVDCTGFELVTGAEITVKFTVTNTATEPTLNVNGTGAKPIQYRGSYILPSYLANGRVYTFRYDGENYELVGDINTDTNTDTKVTQTLTSTDGSYPLLLAPKSQTATKTTTAYFDSGVTLNPSTNTIAANISGSAGTASKWATARNINGMLVQGDANRVNYGVCSTAATTAAKTVDCAGFTLITGAEITVKFTNTNSAAQPTLNVNNQGAKAIYYRGNYIPPTCLAKDRVYTFRYDGTNYELVGDINTDTNTDTKNTAGSTDTSSKIFLIGAKSQAANPQTYSHDTAYVGTDGCLYSGGAKVSVDGHTHTKSEVTDFPTSLKNPNGLRVQVNGDGASEVRYDGSEAKTINFVAGDNVTLTQKTSENKVTIAAKDTTYSVGTGLSLSGTTFNHSNSVTAGTAQGDASKTLTFGGTFTVPTVTYDAQGHVTGKGTTTMTMPANPNTDTKVTQAVTTINDKFPLLLAPNGQTANATTTAYFDSGVTLNPSTNTIAANISGSASKVANALTVKANGTQLYTYNGSAAKTINIKAGSNITITSDSSGNITISSTASAGSVTGDVGTVVYEASSGGLYCDSKTANNSTNSVAIEDSSYKYKRLRFYCKGYFGLVCTDMPLDRECEAYETGNDRGKRYGGVIFPTAENGNINSTGIGPSNHMYYELKWRVEKEAAGWRVRVVDSGWLGFNAGITSNANYTGNSSAAVAGTNYISWNQRHNNGYCIYKIVAYTN